MYVMHTYSIEALVLTRGAEESSYVQIRGMLALRIASEHIQSSSKACSQFEQVQHICFLCCSVLILLHL